MSQFTTPLTDAGLRGKVVLVEFWTYTCINWLRVQPYVRAWADKYQGSGIGGDRVHAPWCPVREGPGERRRRLKDLRVVYPVRGRQRPRDLARIRQQLLAALYFHRCPGADPAITIRRGQLPESERIIQQLLTEAGATGIGVSWCRSRAGASSSGRVGSLSHRRTIWGMAARGLCISRGTGRDQRRIYSPGVAPPQYLGPRGRV